MPFYIRQSVSVGPFRINLSSSGLGVSAGVRGFRIGTGPRGHYIHAGANGVYYRKTIGGVGKRNKKSDAPLQIAPVSDSCHDGAVSYLNDDGVVMRRIISADSELLVAESHQDALDSLNSARDKISATKIILFLAVMFLMISFLSRNGAVIASVLVIALAMYWLGSRLDAQRRSVMFAYKLDPVAQERYEDLIHALDGLGRAKALAYIKAQGDVTDLKTWKKNSGATSIVDSEDTKLKYDLPKGVASNITPPSLRFETCTGYFFPDCILIEQGKRYGAVRYETLRTDTRDQAMIVGVAPSDSVVIGKTWKFVNKKGGPDRRFKNNAILPICLYEEIAMVSRQGFKALLQTSLRGSVGPLRDSVAALARVSGELTNADPLVLGRE